VFHALCPKNISARISTEFINVSIISERKILEIPQINHGHKSLIPPPLIFLLGIKVDMK
jgi:hypothetical protein